MRKTNGYRVAACLVALAWLIGPAAWAQAQAFRQALLELGTDLRVMCVAAHPDDEDGATLALYRKRYGARTYAVVATRGEGGQNEIGPELYEALAVIRTREMMEAAAITGAELRFLNLPDFGYSKTADETFAKWGRSETVGRLVRAIREVRPDVIITHHGKAKDHGHHQAIGAALVEAFDRAADPEAFAEQFEAGLAPWQPARLYVRAGEGAPGAVAVAISAVDPFEGIGYAEMAARALDVHRSQGMGYYAGRYRTGRPTAYYELVKEAAPAGSGTVAAPAGVLFEGLMDRVSGEARALSESQADPATLLPRLLACDAANAAAVAAAGLGLSATPDDAVVVAGQPIEVSVALTAEAVEVTDVRLAIRPAAWFPADVRAPITAAVSGGRMAPATFRLVVPAGQPPTLPAAAHVFDETFWAPAFEVVAEVGVAGSSRPLEVRAPVRLDVAPAVSVAFVDAPYLVRPGRDRKATFKVRLTNRAPGPRDEALVVRASPGMTLEAERFSATFDGGDAQRVVTLTATFPRDADPRDYCVTALATGSGAVAHGLVRAVDVALPEGLDVGVVQSYDDTFIHTLERLGVPHAVLTEADLTARQLARFTTVIVDIRAYLVRDDLVERNAALLKYAKEGGTVIVMYQKTHEWQEAYAPYPIRLSRNRVTVEEAPIEVLVPGHALFTTPNAVGPFDWVGWRQERGLYFPDRWDRRYTPLIRCVDPGEDVPPGSCLVAEYGKGTYVYTALGWYRQLRELHPGALRVFANMLAL